MKLEMKQADVSVEASALAQLDKQIFSAADCFGPEAWNGSEAFWILADGRIVGSVAMELNAGVRSPHSPGCLYVTSTGILPEFQGRGIGTFAKQWQIEYARRKGFVRIETNCRASNSRILSLNKKFGFVPTREIPHCYKDPEESAIVLELVL